MNKNLRKKKAFYAGVISIILCLSMFVSTTMAWFTDTVAIEGNRIEVGDVEVRLHMYNEETGKYEDISGRNGDVFGEDNGQQWEPCKTEIIFLKAVNSGNMSLEYTLLLDGSVEATEAEWEAKKTSVENPDEEILAELRNELDKELAKLFSNQPGLDYAIIPNMDYTAYQAMMKQAEEEKKNVSIWDILEEQAGEENVGSVILNELTYIPYGEMKNTQKEEYMVLAVRMSPYAGNDFQGRTVNVDVNLTAKQLSHEFDSHGNEYDEDAIFEGEYVVGELLTNGNVEEGKTYWSTVGNVSSWDKSIFVGSYTSGRRIPKPDDNPENDKYFKMFATQESNVTISQSMEVVGGKNYTVGAQYYMVPGKGDIQDKLVTKVLFYDADGGIVYSKERSYGNTYREWLNVNTTYTAPEDAVKLTIYFRARKASGVVYMDNLSVQGILPQSGDTDTEARVYPYYEGIEGATNLFVNPGFEELITEVTDADYGYPVGWSRYKKAANPDAVRVTNEYDDTVKTNNTYDGEHSVVITGAGKPYVLQKVHVKPNTTYQFSVWTKVDNNGNDANAGYIKLEFSDDDKFAGMVYMTPYCGHTERFNNDEWARYTYQFTTPGGCDLISFYLRLANASYPVYYDNAELIQISATSALDVRTNEIFYYDEWGNAMVTATASFEEDANKFVKFYLMDGEKILDESEPLALNGLISKHFRVPSEYYEQEGLATWEFDISLMKDYMEEYTVKAVLCDAQGNPVDSDYTKALAMTNTVEKEVYRSSAPKIMNLDENGVHDGTYTVMNNDGTINDSFVPVIGYHAYNRFDEYAQFGVNVIQNGGMISAENAVSRVTNRFEKNGLYSLVNLYLGMNPAGSPANADNTAAIVEAVKDLPGTFGYMIMDEPGDQSCDEEALKEAYRIIRSIDDKHPVYTCEIDQFEWAEKYVDIMSTDPYPGAGPYPDINEQGHFADEFNLTSNVYNLVKPGVEEFSNEGSYKPFYSIVQAFDYKGLNPSYDHMRTQIYMSIFAGAVGYGFYHMDSSIPLEDGTTVHMIDSPMMAAAKEMVDSGEQSILYDYFIHHRGELFMEERAEEPDGTILSSKNHVFAEDETKFTLDKLLRWDHGDVKCRYVIWKEADSKGRLTGNLYAMLMDGNAMADHVSIPLDNGTESIGEFTATVIGRLENGVKIPSFEGNGTLEFDLGNSQSVLIKIVPKK